MVLFVLLLLPFVAVGVVWMNWWLRPERPLRTLVVEMDVNSPPAIIRGAAQEWALLIPAGSSAADDRVWRFDSTSGTVTAIETRARIPAISPSLAFHSSDWWVWVDTEARLHAMSLPDGLELWRAPPTPRLHYSPAAYLSSPDGRYLIIPVSASGPVEVWEIATGSKLASVNDLTDFQLRDFRFDKLGRLMIAGRSRDIYVTAVKSVNRYLARIVSYELPSGRVVKDLELPCPANDAITLIDDKYCFVGNDFGSGQWWDVSSNLPRVTEPPSLFRMQLSDDDRFSVLDNNLLLIDWSLIESATNRIIVHSSDPQFSNLRVRVPRTKPAFSRDGRFLILESFRMRKFPNWMPSWIARQLISFGWKEANREIVLIDTATGGLSRRLPGNELLLAPANSDVVWTISQDLTISNGLTLREWPLKQRGAPWWLWILTACVIAWYMKRRLHVKHIVPKISKDA